MAGVGAPVFGCGFVSVLKASESFFPSGKTVASFAGTRTGAVSLGVCVDICVGVGAGMGVGVIVGASVDDSLWEEKDILLHVLIG